jgi:hypothetical protein
VKIVFVFDCTCFPYECFVGDERMVKNGEIGEKLKKKGYLMPKTLQKNGILSRF